MSLPSFQIKNFVSIVAAMINHMRGTQSAITDFSVGSVARTLIEAPAIEIDQLYQQMFNGLMNGIPTATYGSFNFDALPGVAANGVIAVTITSQTADTLIAAGTTFASAGASETYVSLADVTITAGNTTASVSAAAADAGTAGNIPSGTQFSMNPSPSGFVSATNALAFNNGQDPETPDQQKQRFGSYVQTLARSTVLALITGAKTVALYNGSGIQTEAVATASVVEPWLTDNTQPVSLVNLYIHNGVGSTSGALVSQCETVMLGYTGTDGNPVPGWKAAGVKVVVAAATEVPINVTATVTAVAGNDPTALASAASAALQDYIRSLAIGASFVEAEASFRVMSLPGALNVTGLPADTTSTASQKLMPGTFTITGAGG